MQNRIKKITWLKLIVKGLPVIAAVIVFLSTRVAANNPGFIESHYSKAIYPFMARILSGFSGLIPFSLWDIFWTSIILLLNAGIVLAVLRKITPGRFLLRLIQAVSLGYVWLYFSWGYNYFRPDISTRLGWEIAKTDETEFRSVLDTIIFRANSCYINIDSSGIADIDSLTENSFAENSNKLGLIYPGGTRLVKKMIFSEFIAKSGMSGYFGPYFNEVHLNSFVLPIDYPFSSAHEKSHQFGIGSEAEANLVSYVICTESDDQRMRYSAYMMMLLYFLNDASGFSDYRTYLGKIDRRVIKDLIFRRDYYKSLQNKTLDDVHSAVNDAYLKANNIKSGVDNYNQVVALVVNYYKQ